MKFSNKAKALAMTTAVVLSPMSAMAADGDIDVSSVVTKIGLGAAAAALIGLASLGLQVGIKLYKRVSAAI